jgi:tripartite-type tricarboxylate transporter receptor subunit TctC
MLRTLATVASKAIGQPIVIEARPGAFAMVAAQALARAKPDGYTIGVVPVALNRMALLGRSTVDLMKEFTFLAQLAGQTNGLVTQSGSRFKTVADLVKFAKESPGSITYGTSGIASHTHVAMEDFAYTAGIKLTHVPYKGGAETMRALMGGEIDLLADSGGWVPLIESGKMQLLSIWNEQRAARFPNVPTMKELGYNLVMTSPFGLGAPAGLDPQIAVKLRQVLKQAALSPEFKAECDNNLAIVMYQDADDFRKYAQENYNWEKAMIERLNFKEKVKE